MEIIARPGPKALEDAETCAALHTAAFAASGARGWSAQEIKALLDRPTALLLTAPHGFLLAEIIADETEIVTFAVDPERQGEGIGHSILSALCNTCRCRNIARCILEVAENNSNAIKLYHAFNFSEISVRKSYFRLNTGMVGALVMEKHFVGT